jgi:hypothetical protein
VCTHQSSHSSRTPTMSVAPAAAEGDLSDCPGQQLRRLARFRQSLLASVVLRRCALAGDWTTRPQAAVLNSATGRIACCFHARDLHLVMGSARPASRVRFRVSVDGQPPGAARVLTSTMRVMARSPSRACIS